MILNHVGIVVKNLEEQGEAYRRMLGLTPTSGIIEDPLQHVQARFWKDPRGAVVELIAPLGPESPAWRAAQKGGGLDHLCYETPELDTFLAEAVEQGAKIVRQPVPAIAFGGRRIAFIYSLDLGLIELLEAE